MVRRELSDPAPRMEQREVRGNDQTRDLRQQAAVVPTRTPPPGSIRRTPGSNGWRHPAEAERLERTLETTDRTLASTGRARGRGDKARAVAGVYDLIGEGRGQIYTTQVREPHQGGGERTAGPSLTRARTVSQGASGIPPPSRGFRRRNTPAEYHRARTRETQAQGAV